MARLIPLAPLLILVGCTDGPIARDAASEPAADAPVDATAEALEDPEPDPSADPAPDTAAEPAPDPADDGPCTYPPGPYSFDGIGSIVGPCSWPSAVPGSGESLPADFEVLHCDPDVETILVFLATPTCPFCPDRIRELVGLRDHFDTYGAKWVWVLDGASSADQARAYFEDKGVTFGWMTHDLDNSQGASYLADTPMSAAVPWIGLIDARNMRVAYNNPVSIERIVREMGSD